MTAHPLWPLAVVALLATIWFGRLLWLDRRSGANSAGSQNSLPNKGFRRLRLGRLARRFAMALLVLLMAVRPVAGATAGTGANSQADILLVIDRTISMRALDYAGDRPRIDGVRQDVKQIIENSPGARFAVISFDASPQVETPFTSDTTAVQTLVDAMPTQSHYYAAGSSISSAVPLIEKTLVDARKATPDRVRHVLYLGDGEHTVDTPVDSFAKISGLTSDGMVLGYGTDQGGRMLRDDSNREEYVPDDNYDDAISRIDEKNLELIADQLDVPYRHRTAPGPVDFHPKSTFGAALGSSTVTSGFELYWIFAIGVFILALAELWNLAGGYRQLRKDLL